METQIQIGKTNTIWQNKYNMATQIKLGDTNTVITVIVDPPKLLPTKFLSTENVDPQNFATPIILTPLKDQKVQQRNQNVPKSTRSTIKY